MFSDIADALRTELQQRLEAELENIRKSHGAELRTARMELERAVEISKQKVGQPCPSFLAVCLSLSLSLSLSVSLLSICSSV